MPDTQQSQSTIRNPQSAIGYHFCTYFDRHYLYKGLALYRSLARHCDAFTLWVLCFDQVTHEILSELDLPGVRLIARDEFERGDDALLEARRDRTLVEYYWTCTPSLLLYVLRYNPQGDILTYLDADLFFFSDPQPIYDELGAHSILIIEHRYAPKYAHFAETAGIYNVGALAFRHDRQGVLCLQWWRDRCLKWCFARVEDGKFGDQKYLDDWPARFRGVVVLQHKGAGLAPWNIANYRIERRDGNVLVDGDPLVFYHFHNLSIVNEFLYEPVHHGHELTRRHVDLIYRPYIRELHRAIRAVRRVAPGFHDGYVRRGRRTIIHELRSGRLVFHPGIV